MDSNFGEIGLSVAELWVLVSAAYAGGRFISFGSGFVGFVKNESIVRTVQ